MPAVKLRRTVMHIIQQLMELIESGGKTATFVPVLMPTTAHAPDQWIMGYDLYPMDTLGAKQRFAMEAVAKNVLVFFAHDPAVAAGYIRESDGKRSVVPAIG